jgi:hypothetical protein
VPDGVLLVSVYNARYQWHGSKPYYALRLKVLEPQQFADCIVSARIYCTPKALWKLNWFLREFGYDLDLIGRDEIDDKALVGLKGVVKISTVVLNGTSFVNLDGFAPADQWPAFAGSACTNANAEQAS